MSVRRPLRLFPYLLCLVIVVPAWAAPNPYRTRTVDDKGRPIDMVIVPGRPPAWRMPAVNLPRVHTKSLNTLTNVPTLDWCYGCSPTSAAMIFGYYDNMGYPDMYTGPTNGGVFPQTNAAWGVGECPLSATHNGYDGRTTRGHVDDYWIAYDNAGPDPWIANSWLEHVYADCTGDFMGTNQSRVGNVDASTTFFYWQDNSPLYDYSGSEPGRRDGCHGMRDFAVSRGYSVTTNYNQYIAGHGGLSAGFTYADYKAEIDAGRPVLIQVDGHTMVGVGYDDATSKVYIHDTWDHQTHEMTWGGSYSGMAHYGVTVLQLATVDAAPTTPSSLTISPASPVCASTLQATASGSTDPNNTTPTYEYEWSQYDGGVWTGWSHLSSNGILTGVTLARDQQWRVQARATDGALTSDWTTAVQVTIANSAPIVPPGLVIIPASPVCTSALQATASGASDPDGLQPTYKYQWTLIPPGAVGAKVVTWSYDGTDGNLTGVQLHEGEVWAVHACATDGDLDSAWTAPVQVTIGNTAPVMATVTLTPLTPRYNSTLIARATASDADGEAFSYTFQWRQSTGGAWGAWGHDCTDGRLVGATLKERDQWQAQARASDGTANSDWQASGTVTIGNYPPFAPTGLTISPVRPTTISNLRARPIGASDADGDSLTYRCDWSSSTDGGATWSAWGSAGIVLSQSKTAHGQQWRVRCRVSDGQSWSAYRVSAPVTILNTAPTTPTVVSITPANPGYNQDLTAAADGSGDVDSDTVTYSYQWARSRDGGTTWSSWRWDGPLLSAAETVKGDLWKSRARATDGTAFSAFFESAPVTIGATPAVAKAALALTSAAAPTRAGRVAVTVSLSSAANVQVEVCNLAGRLVAVLPSRALPGGVSTLLWSGASATGTTVPNGTYLLRVTARDADGRQSQSISTLNLSR